MKFTFFVFFLFCAITFTKAQSVETVSELTPVPSYIGKFSKRLPKNRYRNVNENLKFDVKIEFVKLPNDKKGVGVVVQANYNEIVFVDIAGKMQAKIRIYGRITSKNEMADGFFQDDVWALVEVEELLDTKNKFLTLRKVFELPESNYQIGVIVKDIMSEDRGVKIVKFQVPATAK